MIFKSNCVSTVSDKRIVFSENGRKLTLLNPKQEKVRKVEVDGCQIKQGLRCDYLAITSSDWECFIELKGNKLTKAKKQLESSIDKLSSNKKRAPKRCYIICSRSPLASPSIQKLALRFKKEYNAKLIVKTSKFEDRLP